MVYNTTLATQRLTCELIHLADRLLPNLRGATEARLPLLALSVSGPATKYLWARVLAWQVTGQLNQGSRTKSRATNHVSPVSALITALLPSGHLDAVIGAIDICAPRQIKLEARRVASLRHFYCQQKPSL